ASFVMSNTLILTFSTGLSIGAALGANYVLAGALAIAAGLIVFFWPGRRLDGALFIIAAAAMIVSSVMTSHSVSRTEDREVLAVFTAIHYLATAAWIGGLPYLIMVINKATEPEVLARVSRRFSRLAQISVAFLFGAGLGLSVWYVGSWKAIYG